MQPHELKHDDVIIISINQDFIKMLHGLLISYPSLYNVFFAIDYLNLAIVTAYSSYRIINKSKDCVVCTKFYVIEFSEIVNILVGCEFCEDFV